MNWRIRAGQVILTPIVAYRYDQQIHGLQTARGFNRGPALATFFNLVNHDRGELNPVLLLLLEARADEAGNPRWEYASRRLTIWSTSLRLDGHEVSYSPIVRMADEVQKDWTFFFLPRDFE